MPDARQIQRDFPVLQRKMRNGQPVAFLDSAASSQKPNAVLDAMQRFYQEHYANVHRGVYQLGAEATEAYEAAHERTARFIKAPDPRGVVFTRNCTEALNLLAYSFGLARLQPGDEVVVSILEHHSNFVPWQQVCKRTGATFRVAPITKDGHLDLEAFAGLVTDRTKIVSLTLASNVLGTLIPAREVARIAHDHGALFFADAAQWTPHLPTDVGATGADAMCFSGHKMLGPSGIGVLWARPDLLEDATPFNYGGEMISRVTVEETRWKELPWKFEAGTPPIVEAVGLHAAMDYLDKLGMDWVHRHSLELATKCMEVLTGSGCEVYGPPANDRCGVVSFNVPNVHPHDLASLLDDRGVAVRAGHHCAQPLMDQLGLSATTRASFHVYNTSDDVERLVEALRYARGVLGVEDRR